jgi:hypothetical protein
VLHDRMEPRQHIAAGAQQPGIGLGRVPRHKDANAR